MKKLHRYFSFSGGFTLIEAVVVVGVFVVLSTVIVSILVTVFRSTNKSDSVILVRQNGEYAMERIVRGLRFAKDLDYPNPGGADCDNDGESIQYVTITDLDLVQATFSCPGTVFNSDIGINAKFSNEATSRNLTNVNTVTAVSTPACSFVCTQPADGGPPTIGISFRLTKISTSGLTEANSTIPFQSSVTLRNIGNQ